MTVQDELQRIYDEHGELTPELVVEAARPEASPLHAAVFNRPVGEAAEAWYRESARQLIKSIKITRRDPTDEERDITVRAFHAVRGGDGQHVFHPADVVAEDPVLSQILLAQMERDWKDMFARYGHMVEFVALVARDLPSALVPA